MHARMYESSAAARVPVSDIRGTVVPKLSTERTSIVFWSAKIDGVPGKYVAKNNNEWSIFIAMHNYRRPAEASRSQQKPVKSSQTQPDRIPAKPSVSCGARRRQWRASKNTSITTPRSHLCMDVLYHAGTAQSGMPRKNEKIIKTKKNSNLFSCKGVDLLLEDVSQRV